MIAPDFGLSWSSIPLSWVLSLWEKSISHLLGKSSRCPQHAQLAPGAWMSSTRATEPGSPPGALQFLPQGAGFARPPGQGGKAEGPSQVGAAFQQRIMGPRFSGDLEKGQAEQGATRKTNSTNSTSATTLSPGAGGHARTIVVKRRESVVAHGRHKKAPPMAGPGWEPVLESSLGRCDHRGGDAPTQAAAPAEGRTSAEQEQGARNHCGGCGRRSNEHIDGFGGAIDGPGARQARNCEALGGKVCVVEGCAA
jgi:hypothetical protein